MARRAVVDDMASSIVDEDMPNAVKELEDLIRMIVGSDSSSDGSYNGSPSANDNTAVADEEEKFYA